MEGSFALAVRSVATMPDHDCVERTLPHHLQFLNIPSEIRNMIYSHCVEGEQEEIREYVGHHSNAAKSDFCTPLQKARPPSLIRVCKQTRAEYLPIYFRETCFRVYVEVTPSAPFGHNSHPTGTNRVDFDIAALKWLHSIDQIHNRAFFRNLQFRLTLRGGLPAGPSFNITYNAQQKRYHAQFVVGAGWPPVQGIDLSSVEYDRIESTPRHAWACVKRMSEVCTREWIDWSEVEVLRHKLRYLSGVDMAGHLWKSPEEREWRDWSDETGRICTRPA